MSNEIICPHCKKEVAVSASYEEDIRQFCTAPVLFVKGKHEVDYNNPTIDNEEGVDDGITEATFTCQEGDEEIDTDELNKAWNACHNKPKKRRDTLGRKLDTDLFKKAK